ncbi:MAG: hypothetical protein JXR96_02795 [Deltaproteobacteria bacterium]|nr:hypothetical protein [Deltaproteobacteria bacterium]
MLIDRNAVEADIKAQKTSANAVRSMLGLNLQAGAIKADSPIWLPRLPLDEALKLGQSHLVGKFGACKALVAQK